MATAPSAARAQKAVSFVGVSVAPSTSNDDAGSVCKHVGACASVVWELVTCPVRLYLMHPHRPTRHDLMFTQRTPFGMYRAFMAATTPARCVCSSLCKTRLYENPWTRLVWLLTQFVTYVALASVAADESRALKLEDSDVAWSLELYHVLLVFVLAYLVLSFALTIRTMSMSYDERLESETFTWPVRATWVCFSVGYPALAAAAPLYQVFTRTPDVHGPCNDALHWCGFSFFLVEVVLSRNVLLPAHVVWVVLIYVLDSILLLALHSHVRFTAPQTLVALACIVLVFGVGGYCTVNKYVCCNDDQSFAPFDDDLGVDDDDMIGDDEEEMSAMTRTAVSVAPKV